MGEQAVLQDAVHHRHCRSFRQKWKISHEIHLIDTHQFNIKQKCFVYQSLIFEDKVKCPLTLHDQVGT